MKKFASCGQCLEDLNHDNIYAFRVFADTSTGLWTVLALCPGREVVLYVLQSVGSC